MFFPSARLCLPLVFVLSGFSIFFLGLFLRVCMCFVLSVVLPFLLVFSLFAFFFRVFLPVRFFILLSLSSWFLCVRFWLVGSSNLRRGEVEVPFFAGGRSQVSLSSVCSVSVVCAPWSCFWCSAVATEDGDLELLLKTKWGRAAGILWSQLLFLSSLRSSSVLFVPLWFIPQRLDLIALINEIEAYR